MGDFPLLPDGCPFDSASSGRRRLVGAQRVVGAALPSVPWASEKEEPVILANDGSTRGGTHERHRRLDGDAADDATEASVNAVYDQGALVLPDLNAWKRVLSWRPNEAIQTALDEQSQYLQRIEDALEMVAVDHTGPFEQ